MPDKSDKSGRPILTNLTNAADGMGVAMRGRSKKDAKWSGSFWALFGTKVATRALHIPCQVCGRAILPDHKGGMIFAILAICGQKYMAYFLLGRFCPMPIPYPTGLAHPPGACRAHLYLALQRVQGFSLVDILGQKVTGRLQCPAGARSLLLP